MPFDSAALLTPASEAAPCGADARGHDAFDELRRLASLPQRPDWVRVLAKALALAREARDLRVWVWLTRASLCAEGVPGLAAGLELIAGGLDRYWDVLPPLDAEETDPRERFLGRLNALTELGVTNFRCNTDDLLRNGRGLVDLRADLDAMAVAARPDDVTRAAVDRARTAARAIGGLFAERFGAGRDPQLGFELILAKLAAVERKVLGAGVGEAAAGGPDGVGSAAGGGAGPGAVASRDDVVRVLDLVIAYYERHEPSSPVPLLVRRAKRLVPLSFAEALKDIAPSGLKELQVVTGVTDDRKGPA